MMEDKRAVGPLVGLLSDEKDHVRYMAVKALGEIGADEAMERIASLSGDENPYVRRVAEFVVLQLKPSNQ
jgi:HEAT repeat protein